MDDYGYKSSPPVRPVVAQPIAALVRQASDVPPAGPAAPPTAAEARRDTLFPAAVAVALALVAAAIILVAGLR